MLDSPVGCPRQSTAAAAGNKRQHASMEDSSMRLSRAEVEHVAALARLGLSHEEIDRLRDQLSSILGHIAALDRIDTAAIPPTAQVIALTNVMRDDAEWPSLPREIVLMNAPRQTDGFFEVHAVLGGDAEDA
jgi:aspartyl-tRNA(Asn)/glutamyl-tRNA(Gln) amidotransferase subunit C